MEPAAAFDALVAAYEPGPGPGGLRALVPLAGRSLVEHQLRRAAAAGAERLLLLVDEMPIELADVLKSLRREGVAVTPIAGLDAAADVLPPDRDVLLVADACLAEEILLRRLAARGAPCLATLPDIPAHERYERIDAEARWAGVALLDGRRVAAAVAMLGSWDPVLTLLRRAVQEGASRIDAGAAPPMLLLDPAEIAAADADIVAAARVRPRGWVERWIHAPLLDRLVPRLLDRRVAPEALAVPAAGLALLAATLAHTGWRWPALIALILAFPLAEAGAQLARIADRPLRIAHLLAIALAAGAALAALGLAAQLARASGQWGWWLVGAMLLASGALAWRLRPIAHAPAPLWLARADALAWTLPPFAAFGRWDIGLAALLAYALVSAGLLLRGLVRHASLDAGLPPPKLF